MKRILSIILCIACFISSAGINTAFAENEKYLNKAQQEAYFILRDLGFLDENYDEEMVIESGNVTRGIFAELAEKVYNTSKTSVDELYFHDVPRTHFAYKPVAYFAQQGIISVGGDKLFNPDNFITKPEAAKIIIYSLGYGNLCNEGTWPVNVNSVAEKFDLYDGTSSDDTKLTYADMLVMLNNSLSVEIMSMDGLSSFGGLKYTNEGETFLSKYYDIYIGKGRLEGYNGVSIFGTEINKGYALIDGKEYSVTEKADLESLLGKKIKFYYKSNDDVCEVILAIDLEDTEELVLNRKNNEMSFDSESFKVSYVNENNRQKSVQISKNVSVVYNGVYLESSVAKVLSGDLYEMRLLKTEGNDYDVIIATEYENYIFENADALSEKLYLTACDTEAENKQNIYNFKDYGEVEIVMPDGSLGTIEQLTYGMVLSIFNSYDNEKSIIRVSNNTMDVNIRSVSEGDYLIIKDDFNEYFAYKKDLELGLQIGNKVRLKFDYEGFVAAVETAGNTVNFGYIIKTFKEDAGDSVLMKFFSNKGEKKILHLSDRVKIDNVSYRDTKKAYDALKYVSAELMAYELDNEGNIKMIDIAAERDSLAVEGDMLLKLSDGFENSRYFSQSGKLGTNFRVGSQTLVMGVSPDPSDSSKDKYFKIGNPSYFTNDNSYSVCGYIYGTEYKEFADVVLSNQNMSSSTWISTNVLVDKIAKTVNKEDEVVYMISGWHGEDYKNLMCSTELSEKLPALQRGDVLSIDYANDEVTGFTVMAGPDATERRVNKTYNTMSRYTMFYPHDVVGSTVYAGFDSGETWEEVFTPGQLTVFIYDARVNEITKGTVKDIITYKMAGENCDDIYVYVRTDGSDRNFVVYRNMTK